MKITKMGSPSLTSPLPVWEGFSLLPSQPGVYWWLDAKKQILYVGKAKNLKKRLKSYQQKNDLPLRTREMVGRAKYVCYQILRSELEALLVEAELINTYQPPFNVLLKDDKSPLYIVMTKEEFPRVLRYRKRDLLKKKITGKIFGPFPSSYKVTEVLKLVRPIFRWCNAPRRVKMRRCFENHLGLCAGVCAGTITKIAYQKAMKQLELFLSGKTKQVTDKLKEEMEKYKEREEFEAAAEIRDKLKMIAEVTSETMKLRQDYFLPNLSETRSENAVAQLRQILQQYQNLPREYQLERIEGYDVSNTSGQQAVVSMVVWLDGQMNKSEYRSFNIKTLETPNDFAMMAEALGRRAKHSDEWPEPSMLLIDGGKGQVRAVLQTLKNTSWAKMPIIGLAKQPDRLVIPVIAEAKKLKLAWQVLTLAEDNLALQLLQQIRDEAHRFGKSKHLKRREKKMMEIR